MNTICPEENPRKADKAKNEKLFYQFGNFLFIEFGLFHLSCQESAECVYYSPDNERQSRPIKQSRMPEAGNYHGQKNISVGVECSSTISS